MLTIEAQSLSSYIDAIGQVHETLVCHSSDVWYRGVSHVSHELVPGVHWRDIKERVHDAIVSEFLTGYVLYEKSESLRAGYGLYALMQHYGLPTRLLDWSNLPLTALYFALEKDEPREERAVWAINPVMLNRLAIGRGELVYAHGKGDYRIFELDAYLPDVLKEGVGKLPEHPLAILVQPTNRRISSQSGKFTMHGMSRQPIDELFESASSDQCIKISISGGRTRERMLDELRGMGIVEDVIYQDLTSLTDRIKREYGMSS